MSEQTLTPRASVRGRAGGRVWAARLGAPLGGLALAGMVVAAGQIAIDATARRSPVVPATDGNGFPGWLRGPLHASFLDPEPLNLQRFATLLIVMLILYGVAVVCARYVPWGWILAAVGGLMALVTLAPPLVSADVFGYIEFGRMGALHGLNPYLHPHGSIPNDPVSPYVLWKDGTTPYGPAFTLLSYALAPLGVPMALWAYKFTALAGGLAIVGLVAACARALGRAPGPAVALVGLNPILLVYGIGGAHNDMLVMAVAMLGIYLALRHAERGAGVSLVVGAALKASAAVIAPFALLGSRRPRRMLTAIVACLVAVGAVTLAVFGTSALGGSALGQQKMISQASVPRQVANIFDAALPGWLRIAALVAMVAVVVWMLWRTWRGADWIAAAGWSTFALILSAAWLLPWYVVWLLPLAALGRSRALRIMTLALTVYLTLVKAVPLLHGGLTLS